MATQLGPLHLLRSQPTPRIETLLLARPLVLIAGLPLEVRATRRERYQSHQLRNRKRENTYYTMKTRSELMRSFHDPIRRPSCASKIAWQRLVNCVTPIIFSTAVLKARVASKHADVMYLLLGADETDRAQIHSRPASARVRTSMVAPPGSEYSLQKALGLQ